MNQFKGQINLQLAPHGCQHQLDLDTVANHHSQEVILAPRVRKAGGGQIALVRDLAESSVQTESSHAIAVLGKRFDSDGSVESGARGEGTSGCGVKSDHLDQ